jgi:hypothetical protein
MTTPHKEAAKLIAIAEGRQMQEEMFGLGWQNVTKESALAMIVAGQADKIRIAPETININGREVAAPVKHVTPYFFALDKFNGMRERFYFDTWQERDQNYDAICSFYNKGE